MISGSGRSPGEGNGHPLQYSGLGEPMDRRSLVGHSLWGRKRVRHNIVTKHKPPIDYNTDRAFLCCLLSLLFRYSKVAVDESSVFLKPPNGSALLAGHLIFASFPGASSCIVCKGFFLCVETGLGSSQSLALF